MSAGRACTTILLVEDDQSVRDAFSLLLREFGYRVLQAGTGAEALRVAAEAAPQLILLDLGLPDMEGLEVARALSTGASTRAIPVVALTGRTLEADQAACFAAGCAGYLAKPIRTGELLRVIPRFITAPAAGGARDG